MRRFIAILLLLASAAIGFGASDETPRPVISKPGAHAQRMEKALYAAYVQRRQERREQALYLRRAYNLAKPPARGWTAIAVPFNPAMPYGSFIQHGWVQQPPIPYPRRRVVVTSPKSSCSRSTSRSSY